MLDESKQQRHGEQHQRETTSVDGVVYDVGRLETYAAEIPVTAIPLEDLREWVREGHSFWVDRHGQPFGPSDLLADWDAAQRNVLWADHVASIQRANLEEPIWMDGKTGFIFNGMHRLTRAFLDGRATIPVRVWKELPQAAQVAE